MHDKTNYAKTKTESHSTIKQPEDNTIQGIHLYI